MIVEGFSKQSALTRLPILPWGDDAMLMDRHDRGVINGNGDNR